MHRLTAQAVQLLAAAMTAVTGSAGLPPSVARADPVLVFPGMEIRQDTHVCTLGYVDPALGIAFTAGHCRGGGAVTDADGNHLGQLASFRDNTPDGSTIDTDQMITDYETIVLADDVAVSNILPDGRPLESIPDLGVQPGEQVCHFGVVTQQSCGTVERVNNGWFTMAHGVVSQPGDSGGPVYVAGGIGPARIVGVFNSVWGTYPAAVSWSAIMQQVHDDAAAAGPPPSA